jgi:hypothetical protein
MRILFALPNLSAFHLIYAIERAGGNNVLLSYWMCPNDDDKFVAYIKGGATKVPRIVKGRRLKGVPE